MATTLCLSRSSAGAPEYSFPYHDPYLATMSTVILNADGVTAGLKRQVVHVPVLPDRHRLPSLEGRGELSIALYRQDRPAPLIFILSGIGSSPYFGLATYFARLFHQVGFHVVILPSPTTWNFALAASRSGAPGYAPEDARDLYAAMQRALDAIRAGYGVKTTSISFMGASLGALEGAYLSVLDGSERKIGIEKYLLVNPPLDLSYALKRLDQWDALQDKFGRRRSEAILARALAIVEPYATEDRDDPATLDMLEKDFSSFTTEEIQFLIAENAQSALPELVYVTQVIHDQRVLKAGRDQARKRLEEARGWTLLDYRQKIAMPLWRLQTAEPAADLESFDRRGSLAPVLDSLRGNPRVYVMHNADDVLVERKPLEELKSKMGDRMTLYPYGGHLGNLWYSENKRAILKLFNTSP